MKCPYERFQQTFKSLYLERKASPLSKSKLYNQQAPSSMKVIQEIRNNTSTGTSSTSTRENLQSPGKSTELTRQSNNIHEETKYEFDKVASLTPGAQSAPRLLLSSSCSGSAIKSVQRKGPTDTPRPPEMNVAQSIKMSSINKYFNRLSVDKKLEMQEQVLASDVQNQNQASRQISPLKCLFLDQSPSKSDGSGHLVHDHLSILRSYVQPRHQQTSSSMSIKDSTRRGGMTRGEFWSPDTSRRRSTPKVCQLLGDICGAPSPITFRQGVLSPVYEHRKSRESTANQPKMESHQSVLDSCVKPSVDLVQQSILPHAVSETCRDNTVTSKEGFNCLKHALVPLWLAEDKPSMLIPKSDSGTDPCHAGFGLVQSSNQLRSKRPFLLRKAILEQAANQIHRLASKMPEGVKPSQNQVACSSMVLDTNIDLDKIIRESEAFQMFALPQVCHKSKHAFSQHH